MNENGWDRSPLGFYCPACSAAVGTPCSDPLTGGEYVSFHRARLAVGGFFQPEVQG